MPIIIGNQGPIGEPLKFVHWLDSLSSDLRTIADGHYPSRTQLQRAPLLASAHFANRPMAFLVNGEDGRDILGPVVNGSNVWVIAPDGGWVRTLSGFYRIAPSTQRRQ